MIRPGKILYVYKDCHGDLYALYNIHSMTQNIFPA